MEEDLKILKMEYLNNPLSKLPKILNLRENGHKWTWSQVEDKFKIVSNAHILKWKTFSKYSGSNILATIYMIFLEF